MLVGPELAGCAICPAHYTEIGRVVANPQQTMPESPPLSDVPKDALEPFGVTGPVSSPQLPEQLQYSVGRQDVYDPAISPPSEFLNRVQESAQEYIRGAYGVTLDFKPPPTPNRNRGP